MLKLALTLAAAAVGASIVQGAPAAATVLEIGDDGAVRTRTAGPGVSWQTAEEKAAEEKAAAEAKAIAAATAAVAGPALVQAPAAPQVPVPPAAVAVTATARIPAAHAKSVLAAAEKYNLSPLLIDAVARQESGYRANVVSRAGAIGIMQLMPGTARLMGVTNPRDPHANIDGGARYLRRMLDRFGGDVALALAAYNAGPGRVERARGIPRIAETQDYVRRILGSLSNAAAAAQAVVTIASVSGE